MLLPMLPVQALAADEEYFPPEDIEQNTTETAVYKETAFADDVDVLEGTGFDAIQYHILQSIMGEDIALFSAKGRLQGANQQIYEALKEKVAVIANGTAESSNITVDTSKMGITYTPSGEYMTNIRDKDGNSIDLGGIVQALLADCPYELYWFDKTTEYEMKMSGSNDTVTAAKFTFYVSKDYSKSGNTGTTDVNKTKTKEASDKVDASAEKIATILRKYENKSDFEKLKGYKDEICALVSYDAYSAKDENNVPYGDPWQMISVFDGLDSTNVVCEGYSKAFKYLCDLSNFSNIECILVTGPMTGGQGAGGGHMWNIVNMDDGNNYLVDVTNCDMGTFGGKPDAVGDGLFMQAPNEGGSVADGYSFTIGESTITYKYDDGTEPDTTAMTAVYEVADLQLAGTSYTNKKALTNDSFDVTGVENSTYDGNIRTVSVAAKADLNPALPNTSTLTTTVKKVVGGVEETASEIKDAGTYKVYVSYPGDDNYRAVTDLLVKEFTIAMATPTNFAQNAVTVTVGGTPVSVLTATALPEGLTATYSVTAGADKASVDMSGMVTGIAEGNATVTVNVAGNNNYNDATAQVAVTVSSKPRTTVTFNNAVSQDYNGTTGYALGAQFTAATASDTSDTNIVWTYTYGSTSVSDSTSSGALAKLTQTVSEAGVYTVDVNYESTEHIGTARATFTINKVNQTGFTVNAVTPPVVYGDEITLTATGGQSTGAVNWSLENTSTDTGSATISANGTLKATKPGSVTVKATRAADTNYNEATATATINIDKATPSLTILVNGSEATSAEVNNGESLTFRATSTSDSTGGAITWSITAGGAYADINPTTGVLTAKAVGNVTVQAAQAVTDNYEAATKTITVEVKKTAQAALNIVRSDGSPLTTKIATGDKVQLKAEGGSGSGAVIWRVANGTGSATIDSSSGELTATGAGTVTVTATKSGGADYDDATATVTLTISKASPALTITNTAPASVVFGSTLALTATQKGTGAVTWSVRNGTGTATINGSTLTPTRAGVVTVTATVAETADYEAEQATLSVTINKADRELVITGGNTVTSGQTLQLGTEGGSDNGIVTWSVESDGGTATIDQNGKLTAGNAGEVIVTATKPADMNFNAATATRTIAIQKANYSGNTLKEVVMNPGQSMEIDLTGYYPSGSTFDSVSVKSEAFFDGTPAFSDGKLSVKLMEGLEADSWNEITIPVKHSNYNDFDIIVRVGVTEKTIQNLSFAQPTMTVTYGDADFTNRLSGAMTDVTYTVSSPDNGVVTVDSQTGRISIVKAGTANIMATAAETDKYAASVDYFTVIVNPKPLTISAVNRTARVGGTAPVLGEVQGTDYNVSGLVGSDTVSGVSVSYAATPDMDIAGTTVILVFGGTVSSNYDVTYVNGTLTVTNQTVTPVDPTPTPEPEPERPVEEERRPVTIGGGSSSSNNNSSSGTTTTTVTNRDGSVTETVRDADGTVTETTTATDGTVTEKVTTSDGTIAETTTAPSGASESIVTLPVRGENSVTLPISPVRAGSSAASAPVVTVEVPAARGTVKTEIPVRGVTAGTVAVLVAADGTETVVKTSVPTADGISLNVNGSMTVKIVENSKPFADVSTSDWHKDAVDFASARGLFNGTSATSFSPDGTMTRGMIATVLHNLEGNPAASGAVAFPDVKSGDWFSDAVQWAASTGLMNGYGSGSFGANDVLTREQLAVILWSHAGKPAAGGSLNFADAAQVSDYAREAMAWAAENGILSGANGNVMPGSSASRAQVAQMLMNYLKAYQQ